jgi:hypothetical protein
MTGPPELSSSLPPNMLNMSTWPVLAAFWRLWPVVMQASRPASTRSRGPKSSIAPHFTSASSTRLLTVRRSTRLHRSSSEVNGPFFSRSATMVSTAPSPTFLTAASPKRIPNSNSSLPGSTFSTTRSTVNRIWLRLMLGLRISTPSRLHSPRAETIFSGLETSVVRTAAIHSTGKFAFR